MPVELREAKPRVGIPVRNLRDGQIARIVEWDTSPQLYVGRTVQRFRDALITVGESSDRSWNNIAQPDGCRVIVVPDGSELVVRDNQ